MAPGQADQPVDPKRRRPAFRRGIKALILDDPFRHQQHQGRSNEAHAGAEQRSAEHTYRLRPIHAGGCGVVLRHRLIDDADDGPDQVAAADKKYYYEVIILY